MSASPHHHWSLEQYVEHERHTGLRYEYVDGQIYAMTGGTLRHAHISGNIFFAFKTLLRGSACVPFNTDAGISAQTKRKYFYPDVSVVCGEIDVDPALPERIANPVVLVEVLSNGTEDYDRTTKFNYYKLIASLSDYLIVEQDRPHITHYTRLDRTWPSREYSEITDQIALPSLGITLLMENVYEGITWEGLL
jgi:Uma2 family endonuclease